MPSAAKFPSSPELKRVLKAVQDAGMVVGKIEIQARKIVVYPELSELDTMTEEEWKKLQRDLFFGD
ncbi:MAG: hypothetical protein AAF251_02300 [Pseudomonadota bacterium]